MDHDEVGELPQIDQAMPGSAPDENDGVTQHLDSGETLLDRDSFQSEEGWNPPDRPPGVDVPTAQEQAQGESLDSKLAAEVPDVGAEDDPDAESSAVEAGEERSGRLVSVDDPDGILAGNDVGLDGAASSAEEAAVHVLDEP